MAGDLIAAYARAGAYRSRSRNERAIFITAKFELRERESCATTLRYDFAVTISEIRSGHNTTREFALSTLVSSPLYVRYVLLGSQGRFSIEFPWCVVAGYSS